MRAGEIEKFADSVAGILGLTGVQIVEDPDAMPTKTALACADTEARKIYVRTEYAVTFDLFFAVAHEMRHIWQAANGWTFDRRTTEEMTVEEYNSKPEEIDANAFAALVMISAFGVKPLFNGLPDGVKAKIENRMKQIDCPF